MSFAFVKQFEEAKVILLVWFKTTDWFEHQYAFVLRQSLEEFDSNPTQLATEIHTNTEIKDD